MGRSRHELTVEQRDQLTGLSSLLTRDQMADYFGINHSTFDRIIARDDDASARIRRGRAMVVAKIAKSVIDEAMNGSASHQFFYLKTQAGWRETNNTHITTDRAVTINLSRPNARA